jgi:hypothetical protein
MLELSKALKNKHKTKLTVLHKLFYVGPGTRWGNWDKIPRDLMMMEDSLCEMESKSLLFINPAPT